MDLFVLNKQVAYSYVSSVFLLCDCDTGGSMHNKPIS